MHGQKFLDLMRDDMTDYEICYECTGYGDDYHWDEEKEELVCSCDNCPNNPYRFDECD